MPADAHDPEPHVQFRETVQASFAAIAAIADSAGGYAALSLMRPNEEVVAAEFKINLLRPAVGSAPDKFSCRGDC